MQKIVSAEALDNYKLKISFSDGLNGVVDLSDMVGDGVFSVWNDYSLFSQVFIDEKTHTVAWPGDIDLCPDQLYEEIAKKTRAA